MDVFGDVVTMVWICLWGCVRDVWGCLVLLMSYVWFMEVC